MLKKNLFYNTLLSVSQFIFPLVTFPYTTRILNPEGIGAVNFIDSFTQYFILFSALGIPIYGIRETAKRKDNPEELKKLFNEIMIIHISSTLIFSVIYFFIAFFTPSLNAHMDLVLIGICMMLFNTISIEWFFQGIEKFAYITKRTLIIRTLSVLSLFIFLKPGSPPSVYYAIIASISLINGISNLYQLRKHISISRSSVQLRQHVQPLVIILSSSLAVTAYVLLDNVILGFLKGVVAVGIYSAAIRIVRIPYAFINAINGVMVPEISRAYSRGDMDRIQECIDKSVVFISLIGVPIVIGLMVSAPFIVHSFAGKNFADAIIVLQVIAPVIMLVGFNSMLTTQLLTPIGREKYILLIVILGMLISLILNFCLIPVFSYLGAAITSIITEIVVTALCFYYSRRFIPIHFNLKIFFQVLAFALLFIPAAFILRKLSLNYILEEISVILVCIAIYTACIWFFVNNTYINNFKTSVANKLKFNNV